MYKKILNFIVLLTILLSSTMAVWGKTPVVYVNNELVDFQGTPPTIIDGRVLVPARGVFEKIGAAVKWNNQLKFTQITYNGTIIELFVNANYISYLPSGSSSVIKVPIDVPAQVFNERVLIPLGAVSGVLNAEIIWQDSTKTVYINTNSETITKPQLQNNNVNSDISISVNGTNLNIGDSSSYVASKLGNPDRVFNQGSRSIHSYNNDYRNYIFIEFVNDELVYFLGSAKNISIIGNKTFPDSKILDEHGGTLFSIIETRGARNLEGATSEVFSEMEMQFFDMTNAIRALKGLAILKHNPDVSRVAKAHSVDMATNNYFEHVNRSGEDPGDRLKKSGIQYSYCAENIALGYRSALGAIEGLYHSEGHRENILNPMLSELGVGVHIASDGSPYYTQNFITP